jgi:hypothetical protein
MPDLSGRVQDLENQMETVVQDLLQRVDLVTASYQSTNWNQQFGIVDNTIGTMKSQLQTLQSLYTNLYIRFQSSSNLLGALTGARHYGSFYSTGNYTNPFVTGVNIFNITNTGVASGVSVVSGSRITFSKQGIYDIQFSAQFHKTDAGDDEVDIWLSKNGTYEPWSNSRIMLHGNSAYSLPSWNFLVPANSGDYYQFYWHSSDPDMFLESKTGLIDPPRPDIPSLIITVAQEQ